MVPDCWADGVLKGLDALMHALKIWNGGVILISHDERFITTVATEVRIYTRLTVLTSNIDLTALGMWRRLSHEIHG